MNEIKGENYNIFHNKEENSVEFHGSIRLRGTDDYLEISTLMDDVAHITNTEMILNFKHLEFLNSSGINVISRFVIRSRKEASFKLKVIGNKDVFWQGKSLKNLQKLWPEVQIDIV